MSKVCKFFFFWVIKNYKNTIHQNIIYISHAEKFQIIQYVSFPLSTLSILSTLFVFSIYLSQRQLQIFPYRVVVYIQISDFILSLSQFLIFFEPENLQDPNFYFLFQFQAFLMQYGVLATILWSTILTTLILASLWHRAKEMEKYENVLIFIGFYLPGAFSVMSLS